MRWLRVLLWLLLAGLASTAVTAPASAQSIVERLITPGPLSRAHADLESDCDSCHTSFQRGAENGQCIDCHEEVGRDISRQRGFHGRYGRARTQSCRSCHSEHHGRGHQLVSFNRERFNHNLTDYPLTGGHRGVTCSSCHGRGNDFRGTTTSCASCHREDEPHRGQLGRSCQDCHQTAAWDDLKPFDHRARTGWSLTGAHASTGCTDCHADERWENLGTSCISCHRQDDSHRGTRGTNCASCHRTTRWPDVTFDHDSTGFALNGGHAAASCASCHGANNANRNPSRECIACHREDDTHEGGNGEQCADCHTTRAWDRVTFDHDSMTDFPLLGQHRGAECAACHVEPAREVSPPVTCFGCHEADDDHNGARGTDCARCHTESAWDEVDFDHDTMTEFPLLGAHGRADCEGCHTSPPDELPLETACASCHADDDPHAGNLGENCARCHDAEDWTTNVRFDHELTRFPLLGSHAGRECVDCHEDTSFASAGTACADCHEDDYHLGTLGRPANCQSCHNTLEWTMWSFDHDRQTRFALTGQHRGLVCSACHARAGDPAQQPGECVDCHRRDDRHRGEFGSDCARCHVTDSFADIILP